MPGVAGSQRRGGDRFDVPCLAPEDEFAFWARVAPKIEADLAPLVEPPLRACVVAYDDNPMAARLEIRHPDPEGPTVPVYIEVCEGEEELAAVEVCHYVQESALFDDTFDPWPRCPRHPEAGHSLRPTLSRGEAVWQCPADRVVVTKIGSLNQAPRR